MLFFSFVENPDNLEPLKSSDLIGFGLMLCIANICVLAHEIRIEDEFKIKINGPSIIIIVLFGMLYTLTCIEECEKMDINLILLKRFSLYLAISASLMSYTLWVHIARLRGAHLE